MPEQDPYLTRGRAVGLGRFDGDPAAHDALNAGRKAHERSKLDPDGADYGSDGRAAAMVESVRRKMMAERTEQMRNEQVKAMGGAPQGFHMPHLGGQSLVVLVFVPWSVFVLLSMLYGLAGPSSFLRGLAIFLTMAVFVGSAVLVFAHLARGRSQLYLLIGILCVVAAAFACEAGHILYDRDMAEYWLTTKRGSRAQVPPWDEAGAYRDASVLTFTEGAQVDVHRVLGYRPPEDRLTYCVAPVLDETELHHAEFWAVGIDCCEPLWGFYCGDVTSPTARSGTVLPKTASGYTQRRYDRFLEATKQAAALYHIESPLEPIFLHWQEDPAADRGRELRDAWIGLLLFCVTYLMVSVALAVALRWITTHPPPVPLPGASGMLPPRQPPPKPPAPQVTPQTRGDPMFTQSSLGSQPMMA